METNNSTALLGATTQIKAMTNSESTPEIFFWDTISSFPQFFSPSEYTGLAKFSQISQVSQSRFFSTRPSPLQL